MIRRGRKEKQRSLLTYLFLSSSLVLSAGVWAQDASDDEEDNAELGKVVVTGSRIARTDIEGPQPVTVLTAADIEQQGFTNAFEALESLTQFNGTIQDDQFSGFTQAANTLDLRALGPGRTLILLNGRRATDYPLAFNGQSNVVNLANIPSVMIERIEVLASGASAIYGSDAVAGVVNFILKDNLEGMTVTARYGDTAEGGESSQRLQLAGGWNPGNFHMSYGFEYFQRDPIYASDRDYMDSYLDDPTLSGVPAIDDPVNGVVNSRIFLDLDIFDGNGDGLSYDDPGAAACDPLSHLDGGTVTYSFRPRSGYYCGDPNNVGFYTIRNEKENYSLYSNWGYDFDNGHELFGTVIYTDSETRTDTGTRFWQYDRNGPLGGGVFINAAAPDYFGIGGKVSLWQRIFTPEEAGGLGGKDDVFDEQVFDFVAGFRGPIGQSWDYEVGYSHSEYDMERERLLISVEKATSYFLGDPIGSFDFAVFGFSGNTVVPIYDTPLSRLYTPLSPAQYRGISTVDFTTADTSNDSINAVFTTPELFEMPAGPVGFAGVVEWASQDYAINLDPQLTNGEIFGFTGTGGSGDRDRYAAGAEVSIPLLSTLTATVAGRWDKYDDITRVDDAVTHMFGLEWRPTSNFLVRASDSSSFRAPDMHYVFAEPSGFFTTVTDEYLCRTREPGTPYAQCEYSGVGIGGFRQGSPTLEEEEGNSRTIGFVWEITDNMVLSSDWYEIELTDVVQDLSTSQLIRDEADCRLGQTAGGSPVDGSSQMCQDVLARIVRNPIIAGDSNRLISESINNITVGPINTAILNTSGVDTTFSWDIPTERWGTFGMDLAWNIVTLHEDAQFEGDSIRDRRSHRQIFDNRSRARGVFSWSNDSWNTALTFVRSGSVPNWAETARCCSNVTYNLSAQYHFNANASLGLYVQNLRDSTPPLDSTYGGSASDYPYYSVFNFNPYGREAFLQFEYSFAPN